MSTIAFLQKSKNQINIADNCLYLQVIQAVR